MLRVAVGWLVLAVGLLVVGLVGPLAAGKDDPPALNPFAKSPAATAERDDAVPGYLELSDGTVRYGRLFITRDKRLKIRDAEAPGGERQREIPLQVVSQITCKVKKEWMEKEWRFKELSRDQKLYTGKSYPVREYEHSITLRDGRKIAGDLSGIIYVIPGDVAGTPSGGEQPDRYLFHKRQKGEVGQTLKHLVYVKTVKLGDEAFREGKRKAAARPAGKTKS
jgi:predicted GIY-YIG superfamily endonuclease